MRGIRLPFVVIAGLTALIGSPLSLAETSKTERPNVLLIMVDDLGCEWLSCYGSESIETPVLDRLAREGMRFNNAYSMPQCTPTRVTLLTGQYPWRHGWINHWDVPRWGSGCHFDWKHNLTFARVMKSAGYATAAAGKWQINDFRVQPDAMVRHGFDAYCMWTGFETGNPPSAERYWDPYIHTPAGSSTRKGQFGADVFADSLIDFMKRNKDRPMLMYFPMALTHTPFTTTPLDRDVTGNLAQHKAMIRYVEHTIDRLLNTLDDLKIRDNTIVIFTTDNGTCGGIVGRMNGRDVDGGKATLGEAGVRAPFIVNCPGLVPAGVVTDALTDFTDIMPTLAELAGTTLPADVTIDGQSIADLILGKAKDSPRKWIMSMGFGPATLHDGRVVPKKTFADRVVRDRQYKLWVIDGKPARLFDLTADPGETTNLINSDDSRTTTARKTLEAVVQSFPRKDAAPKYDPTPPQIWDTDPGKRADSALGSPPAKAEGNTRESHEATTNTKNGWPTSSDAGNTKTSVQADTTSERIFESPTSKGGGPPGRRAKRPDILFLFTDDQRFDTIGALNNPAIRTPNMDRLARSGLAFTHAHIMGSTRPAVCMPSRAMLMTGRGLFHLRNDGGNIPDEHIMLPEWLRQNGYATFGTGKWHNGAESFARSFTHGANIFIGGMSDHLKVPIHDFDPTGEYPKEKQYIGKEFSSNLFSNAAVEFLTEYKGDQPFFMYVSYTAPHDPRMAPKQYADMYPPASIRLPASFMPEHPFDNGELRIRDELLAPFPRTPEVVREHIAAYYAMITHADAQIGRVLDALEETGRADNTVIIFSGDNGLAVGRHGLLGKQSLYEHSIRVPLIMSGPGLPRGKTSGALCYLSDIYPTLCDMIGLDTPASVEGKSLMPIVRDPEAAVRDSVFYAYRHVQRGVRSGDWKLILYNVAGQKQTQLFNVQNDPDELNNLANEPAQGDRVRKLTARLRDWMKQTGDPCDLDKPDWGCTPTE